MKNRKFVMGVILGVLISVSIAGGIYGVTSGGSIQASIKKQQVDLFQEPQKEINYSKEKLTILDAIINQFYMNAEEEFDLVEGIYAGYMYGLEDSYTRYLSKEDFNKVTAQEEGKDVGVGIQFTWGISNQYLIVTKVIEGSPAHQQGVKVGDKITQIDGIRAMASNEVEIYEKLIYAGDEAVDYTIVDNNEGNERTVQLTPEQLEIQLIESAYLEEDFAYIALEGLVEGTTALVERELQELFNQGASKIVLDLRGTYSNNIEEAVKLADLFLEEQLLCSVTHKDGVIEYKTTEGAREEAMAILVNNKTSGAIEAAVSGLQAANRAIIIGQETAGHGTLQEYVPLEDGSGLDIAAGLILNSTGDVIRDYPIQPDIRQHITMDNTLEIVTTGKLDKNNDVIIQKAIESLQ